MLFKSTTGDLSNKKDCFLCNLNKNLWQSPKKIVYSSIAQSVERMTVNHDVTGSSPVGGAKEAHSFSMSLNYLYTKFISGRSDNCFIGKEKIWSLKI